MVETAGGATLAQELQRRIVEPLGLRSTYLPGDAREIPGPMSRGYSLPVGPRGEVLDGPLLDFTVQNPSWAWAAGALVSDLEDLVGFFRALLGGRLLPPGLLAEMLSTVPVPPGSIPLPLYDRYGLGLLEMGTPAGRLVGQLGGIPGYLSMVLSTPDGRRQLGVMSNVLVAPDAVYEAFMRIFRELSFTHPSGGDQLAGGAVLGWVVGDAVVPAAPDDPDPRSGQDPDGVGVVAAAGDGVGVDLGRPGAGVAGVVGEGADGLAETLVAGPAEADRAVCLPDWRVTGAAPARQATASGPS